MDFSDRVVVITGGSRGIGQIIAREFSRLNAITIIVSRNKDVLESTANLIQMETHNLCIALPGDVSKMQDMQEVFSVIEKRFGQVDVLVNCAGINIRKSIFDTTEEEWDHVIDVNLKGTFICCMLASKMMAKQKKGAIINISSIGAKRGSTSPHYSASKAGVNGLSAYLAKEMAQFRVRVNVVSPGGIDTGMANNGTPEKRLQLAKETLLGRIGQPIEVAKAVIFLASEDASFITGEILDVNGGAVID